MTAPVLSTWRGNDGRRMVLVHCPLCGHAEQHRVYAGQEIAGAVRPALCQPPDTPVQYTVTVPVTSR